jgi:hypothetical protein
MPEKGNYEENLSSEEMDCSLFFSGSSEAGYREKKPFKLTKPRSKSESASGTGCTKKALIGIQKNLIGPQKKCNNISSQTWTHRPLTCT